VNLDFRVTLIGWKRLERSDAIGRAYHSRHRPRVTIFFDRLVLFTWWCIRKFERITPDEDDFIDTVKWNLVSAEVHELTHVLMPTTKEEYCDKAEEIVLNFLTGAEVMKVDQSDKRMMKPAQPESKTRVGCGGA